MTVILAVLRLEVQKRYSLQMAEKDYGSVEYWEKRYHDSGKDALFDWYFDYKSVENSIVNYLGDARKSGLILGCGNSDWGEYMVRDGYKHVVNIDFSPTVIRYMSHRYRNNSKLECEFVNWCKIWNFTFGVDRVMDVNDLSEIKDGSMDIVVDKGMGIDDGCRILMMCKGCWTR